MEDKNLKDIVLRSMENLEKERKRIEEERFKKYNISAKDISVDSGLIVIADIDQFKNYNLGKHHEERKDLYKEFDIIKGVYEVKWKISNSWNGRVSGEGRLKISSGKMVVVDPCYFISDKWDSLLE